MDLVLLLFVVFVGIRMIAFFVNRASSRKGPEQIDLGEPEDSNSESPFTPYLKHHEGRRFDFTTDDIHHTGMYVAKSAIEVKNPSEVVECECGHQGPASFEMHFLGAGYKISTPERCPDCAREYISEHAIRCASCGLPILPGQPIVLYSIEDKHHPWTCYVSREGKKSVIGCLGWYCCKSGGFFAGYWTNKGFRPEYSHGGTAFDECFQTGDTIYVNP